MAVETRPGGDQSWLKQAKEQKKETWFEKVKEAFGKWKEDVKKDWDAHIRGHIGE